jgi:hypothetical protein
MEGRLSHTLVAFTLEFDNEFEHRVPHRTTDHGSNGSGLLTLAVDVVEVHAIRARRWNNGPRAKAAHATTNEEMRPWSTWLAEWWGYIVFEPNASDSPSRRSVLDS